eukprot:118992_1
MRPITFVTWCCISLARNKAESRYDTTTTIVPLHLETLETEDPTHHAHAALFDTQHIIIAAVTILFIFCIVIIIVKKIRSNDPTELGMGLLDSSIIDEGHKVESPFNRSYTTESRSMNMILHTMTGCSDSNDHEQGDKCNAIGE